MEIKANVNKLVNGGGKVMAILTLTLDNSFVIRNVKIIEGGKNGRFMAMPNFRDNFGNFTDVCYPRSKELRERIENAVFSAYDEVIERIEQRGEPDPESEYEYEQEQ